MYSLGDHVCCLVYSSKSRNIGVLFCGVMHADAHIDSEAVIREAAEEALSTLPDKWTLL